MERDPQISKLIGESGVVPAPEGFKSSVMELLVVEPQRTSYKPLIGKGGRIIILLFVIALVLLSVVFTEPGGQFVESMNIPKPGWKMPQMNWNLGFFSEIKLSTGVAAALVAIFILVLSDAGFSKRKFVV